MFLQCRYTLSNIRKIFISFFFMIYEFLFYITISHNYTHSLNLRTSNFYQPYTTVLYHCYRVLLSSASHLVRQKDFFFFKIMFFFFFVVVVVLPPLLKYNGIHIFGRNSKRFKMNRN